MDLSVLSALWRAHIRTWKDLVIMVIALLVYIFYEVGRKKLFPNMKEIYVKLIFAVVIVIAFFGAAFVLCLFPD